jgi:hypothetical protein
MGAGAKRIFVQPLDEAMDSAFDTLGDIRQEGNSWYKYVLYVGGTGAIDGVDGDAVFYTDDTGYAANQVMQDISDLSGKGIVAGTLQCAIDISTFTSGAYIWIKIKGPDTLAIAIEASVDGTPVAAGDGDPLVLGAADGALARDNTVIDADTERRMVCGVIVDASAKEVVLDCPW